MYGFFFPCRPGKDNQLQFFSNANRFRDVHNQLIPFQISSHTYIYILSEFVYDKHEN